MMKSKSVIFSVDVDEKYLNKWEYYLADKEILNKCYQKTFFSNNVIKTIYLLLANPNADLYCWWWHKSFLIILIARILQRRILCTGAIHMYDYSKGITFYSRSSIYRFLVKSSLRLSTFNLFISNDQFLSVTSVLKVSNPLTIYSSLTLERSINKPNDKEICKYLKENEFKFIFVGWLSKDGIKRKCLLETLKAISICIHNHGKKISFNIIGKQGDGISTITKTIIDLNLRDFVEISLDVNQDDKNKNYLDSDLLITPSYMEGFGNASLEAMSFGCPALVSKYGASSEVVGKTGFIINSIDKYSIAETLSDYMNLSLEDRKLMRIDACKRAYKYFSFEKRFNKIHELIECR